MKISIFSIFLVAIFSTFTFQESAMAVNPQFINSLEGRGSCTAVLNSFGISVGKRRDGRRGHRIESGFDSVAEKTTIEMSNDEINEILDGFVENGYGEIGIAAINIIIMNRDRCPLSQYQAKRINARGDYPTICTTKTFGQRKQDIPFCEGPDENSEEESGEVPVVAEEMDPVER